MVSLSNINNPVDPWTNTKWEVYHENTEFHGNIVGTCKAMIDRALIWQKMDPNVSRNLVWVLFWISEGFLAIQKVLFGALKKIR